MNTQRFIRITFIAKVIARINVMAVWYIQKIINIIIIFIIYD